MRSPWYRIAALTDPSGEGDPKPSPQRLSSKTGGRGKVGLSEGCGRSRFHGGSRESYGAALLTVGAPRAKGIGAAAVAHGIPTPSGSRVRSKTIAATRMAGSVRPAM